MPQNLVIVESPAKAKTIEKFLGPDFTVMSSRGHIRDLAKKSFTTQSDKGLRDFTPNYEIPDDKKAAEGAIDFNSIEGFKPSPYGFYESACTLNDSWGYNSWDRNWKSSEQI